MDPNTDSPVRNSYRRTANYQMEDRRLALRGGALDGQTWTGVIAVGKRVFCGQGAWAKEGVYLVTAEIEVDADGVPANVAVPAFAPDDPPGRA